MLFDVGWPELLLIGVVALVVIGPKDLPRAMRIAGYWMRKARTLSREFQNSVDQMIREAELDEVRQELKKATDFNIENEIQKTLDPSGELAESLKPPDLPDYFEEAPKPGEIAAAEALPVPSEAPLPDAAPEPASEPGAPIESEPAASHGDAAEPAAREPTPAKP